MQKKYIALLLLLSPIHKDGSPFVKQFSVQIGKLLRLIINIHEDAVLTELQTALENVLLSYMVEVNSLMNKCLPEDDCNCISRKDLLTDVNNMVSYQQQQQDSTEVEQIKKIMMSI